MIRAVIEETAREEPASPNVRARLDGEAEVLGITGQARVSSLGLEVNGRFLPQTPQFPAGLKIVPARRRLVSQ